MFHDVPYTDFHELNLDFLLREFRKFGGLKLAVQGDKLVMLNNKDEVVSSVTISYATKALTDKNGKDITAYIYTVAGVGDTVVFTHGDGTTTSLTVPYAEKAKYDLTGHELEDYIYNVQVVGDKLRITHGDGTVVDITVPYAIKASTDINDKPIDTYATTLAVDGNSVVLRDSMGRLLDSITVPYATKALQDVDGDAIKSTYATTLQTGTTTVILKARDGSVLSTITVPYATDAGHADEADHATLATDATNAIETVTVSGDQIVFTTYGGIATSITAPYAVKAQKDDLGNTIKTTYVANVTQDSGSGVLTFWDAMGTEICHLTPIAGVALKDNYGNDIADFIKSIVVSQNSDYVTVTHGTGTTDTLTIHYSETAWKDTNGNVIKNFYISYLECIEDVDDGHYKIVAYNGDTPRAELFRFEVTAYSAQTDINGKDLTSYVADVSYNAGQEIEVKDGNGNLLNTLRNAIDDLSDVETNQLLTAGDLLGYDGKDWTNVALEVALDDLTDVDLTNVSNGDTIVYDSNTNKYVSAPLPKEFDTYECYFNADETYVEDAISSGITNTDFDSIMEYIGQHYYSGNNQVQMTLSKIVNITKGTSNNSPTVSDLQNALAHGVCAIVLRQTYNGGGNGNDLRIGTCNSGDYLNNTALNSDRDGMYGIYGDSSNPYIWVDIVAMSGGGSGSSTISIDFNESQTDLWNIAENGTANWTANSTHSLADLLAAGKDVVVTLDNGKNILLPVFIKGDNNTEWSGYFMILNMGAYPAKAQFYSITTTDGSTFTVFNHRSV